MDEDALVVVTVAPQHEVEMSYNRLVWCGRAVYVIAMLSWIACSLMFFFPNSIFAYPGYGISCLDLTVRQCPQTRQCSAHMLDRLSP